MLESIETKIRKEWQRIYHLSEKILNERDHEKVRRYKRDVRNSIKEIEQLESKKLYLTATKLSEQGIRSGVVKRHEAI